MGTNPYAVAIGDLNEDGTLDLAVANINSDTVSILLGTGTGAFGTATDVAVPRPNSVAIGDLNSDGRPDLAVAILAWNAVWILPGTGTGTFGIASNVFVAAPSSVAIGDFNDDGNLDLAATKVAMVSDSVSVFLGTGSGVFGAEATFGVGMDPDSVAIGDFNGDGTLDLAVANRGSNTVSVLLGTGTGAFGSATNIPVLPALVAMSVAIGDLNGDGRPDLAVPTQFGDTVSILFNTTAYAPSGAFGTPTAFAVGANPQYVATGDLDGDGKSDLVTTNYDENTVSVLLGTGTGAFGPKTDFAAGVFPVSVAIGDLNGDGKADLAVADRDGGAVSILLGAGTGAFGALTTIPLGGWPHSVAIGDLNRDGKPDLVVANYASNVVSILLGTGAGAFSAPTNIGVGAFPYSAAIGDLNGDGTLDLAVAGGLFDGTVAILLGTGLGTFGTATSIAVGGQPYSVTMGDLNADGTLDLALPDFNSTDVSILLGTGTGAFSAAVRVPVGSQPRSVAIGDLNRDGNIDLAVANQASHSVSLLFGSGTGAFGAPTNVAAGSYPASVAIDDLNSDGKSDLAVSNLTSNTVSILLNIPPVQHPLTVSKSGVGSGTVFSNPTGIACGSTCNASFDQGTVVTLAAVPDLISTFTGWSGACTGTGSCVVTMDAAKNVTATFTLTLTPYTLSVTKIGGGNGLVASTPPGIHCGVTCSGVFETGTTVTLTATADGTSTFTGWDGACTGTGVCSVTMTAGTNVNATFTASTADLAVTMVDSPDPVVFGNDLTYTITVTNNGPDLATGVTLSDNILNVQTWVSSTPSQGSCSGTIVPSGNRLETCDLGTLTNGASATVTIVVTPNTPDLKANAVAVTGNRPDPDPSNNVASTITSVPTSVPIPPQVYLIVDKEASPFPATVGGRLTYRIVATNHGPSSTNVTVTDPLPADVTWMSATPSQGTCSGTTTVICSLGTLGNEESATVTIVVTPTAVGTVFNTAVVSGDLPNLNLLDSDTAAVEVVEPPRLSNISARAFVGTGANVAVGGFIISGTGTKQVLLRGFGPTLADFGVAGALANPTLALEWDDEGNPNTPAIPVLSNNDWGTAIGSCPAPVVLCGTPTDIENTGMSANAYAPTNPNRGLDAAMLLTLPPGTYTARLSGVSNGIGVGLIGVDDVDSSQTATLTNISTRAFVGTGSTIAVGGFIVTGESTKQVLIRGFGPTLSSFGVSGVLSDPVLDLEWDHDFNPNTPAILLISNDNWGTAFGACPVPLVACGTPQDILDTGLSTESYAPTNPDRAADAALLVTLPPGTYTAVLRGANNVTGVGLIGVDEVDGTMPPYTFVWPGLPPVTPVDHPGGPPSAPIDHPSVPDTVPVLP